MNIYEFHLRKGVFAYLGFSGSGSSIWECKWVDRDLDPHSIKNLYSWIWRLEPLITHIPGILPESWMEFILPPLPLPLCRG